MRKSLSIFYKAALIVFSVCSVILLLCIIGILPEKVCHIANAFAMLTNTVMIILNFYNNRQISLGKSAPLELSSRLGIATVTALCIYAVLYVISIIVF